MRILDLDLDFFVHGALHYRDSADERPEADEWLKPWSVAEAISFLEGACRLDGKLPGFVVEHHGELFGEWHEAIQAGRLVAPFHVTHVDAHADLGMGDAGYMHLMTHVLGLDPEHRPMASYEAVDDGNYLSFVAGCRWLSDLVYVHNDEGGNDLMAYHLDGFPPSNLQLKGATKKAIEDTWYRGADLVPTSLEPTIPFRVAQWQGFAADAPYDIVCLARSPGFTPVECDQVFDEICERFIDVDALAAG